MSSEIEVSIPWNLPCYVPANGFHPLYEALFAAGARSAPLAARLRPRSLDEFVGQEHLLGSGRPLREAIERAWFERCRPRRG